MFEVIDEKHRLRTVVETCIREAFRRDYEARLNTLPRCLVADTDGDRVTCAASLRFARDGFFSERYLDQPIEYSIARHEGLAPDRSSVVEIGSLAANRPGKVGSLICDITAFLRRREMRWAFFTATAQLRLFLRRTGISMVELGAADPSRIENPEIWGQYYRQFPKVMLVDDGLPVLTLHASADAIDNRGRAVIPRAPLPGDDRRHPGRSGRSGAIHHAA